MHATSRSPVDGAGRVVLRLRASAASESFNSTLEFECLRKRRFAARAEARRAVADYIDRYNRVGRHSSCEMKPPIEYETVLAARAAALTDEAEAA